MASHPFDPETRRARRGFALALAGFLAAAVVLAIAFLVQGKWKSHQLDSYLEETRYALSTGDFTAAGESANLAYKKDSKDPRAIRAMAMLASAAGVEEAAFFWTRLGEVGAIEEADVIFHMEKALEQGDPETALGAFARNTANHPQSQRLPLLAARAYLARGKGDLAASTLEALADPDPELREEAALLRARADFQSSDPARRRQAVPRLVEMARKTGVAGSVEALSDLAVAGASAGVSREFLSQLILRHPSAPVGLRTQGYDWRIRAFPQDRRKALDGATREAEMLAREGRWQDLLHLTRWLNARDAFASTLRVITEERVSEASFLVETRAEALLALRRYDELEALLDRKSSPLSPSHEYYILAKASIAAGRPLGGARDIRELVVQAEAACRNEARPAMALVVAELALNQSFPDVARRASNFVLNFSSHAYEARLLLVKVCDAVGDPLLAAAHAEAAARLRPDSLDAQIDALGRKLEAGLELELALFEATELALANPQDARTQALLSRARQMHGFSE